MPIPFLLAAGAAGIIGVGSHISAKDTNAKAEKISRDAQNLYNEAKESLEVAQKNTEQALVNLGYAKKNVLDSSISQFIRAYDRIKQIELKQSKALNEISHFEIEQKDMIQLQEMVDIYTGSVAGGTAGAAAGAIVALAASGSLPIVATTLSSAGMVLALGDIGGAIGIAGTALSTAAATTPLAAIAAPIVLFTGISASMKADENLEKAKVMYSEAEAAAEKMKTSETLCVGIIDRSEMFHKLLSELNGMFAQCVNLLDTVTIEMVKQLGRKITVADLTDNEIKLIRVTRALAGAVKAVIDTPILSENGELSDNVQKLHTEIYNNIPEFSKNVEEVKAVDFKKEIMTAKLLKKRLPAIAQTNQMQTKTPIILSIPVILVTGIFTYGIGSIIMIIFRLKRYPERRKSNIAILGVETLFILKIIFGIVINFDHNSETQVVLESTDNISDEATNSENVSDKTINFEKNLEDEPNEIKLQPTDKEISSLSEIEIKEITNEVIYETILDWREEGRSLIDLGFPKKEVELASIYHINVIYGNENNSQSDTVAEVEFKEEGYHYFLNFVYTYLEENAEWNARDIEVCRENEWVMLQPTDEEILSVLTEKMRNDKYDYSNITIEQKEQDYTSFTAKASGTIASSEGTKKCEYILKGNWENEKWNFGQVQEADLSKFEPIIEPNDSFVEEYLLQENEIMGSEIELVEKNWGSEDDEYSYIYKYQQIKKEKLIQTRRNVEVEIKFDSEIGEWDYENALIQYDNEFQEAYAIEGVWEGVENETYEASWKYVIEILLLDFDTNEITINSWCEFISGDGEVTKSIVCDNEKVELQNGEYNVPVGGYIVEHTPSAGMDFTYNYIVEDGKIFINEESGEMFLSVQNPKMDIFLGVEMVPKE